MKNRFTLILSFFVFAIITACSGPKDPTFEQLENIKLKSFTRTKVVLTGDIILNNPNPFSCQLKKLDLEVFSDNNIKLTEIEQTLNTEMLAKSDFAIPVEIRFSPTKLMDDGEGLLSSLFSALEEKEVDLIYKGKCEVEVMKVNIEVPIEFEEAMLLKK